MVQVIVDSSVKERWSGETVLTIVLVENCQVRDDSEHLIKSHFNELIGQLRKNKNAIFPEVTIEDMRRTFRSMPNMNPSRYRPASESLIRRCISKGFTSVMPLVDVNNLISLKMRIPIGIYDANYITSSNLYYRIGYDKEQYFTISNQLKNAAGKLVLADDKGVIGSPVADSNRASICAETSCVVVIGYLPFDTSTDKAKSVFNEIETFFSLFFDYSSLRKSIILLAD